MKIQVAWQTTSYFEGMVEVDDADDDGEVNEALDLAERDLEWKKQDRAVGLKWVL